MMKKLTKAALLAAATAFLLAAFPACEHENKDPKPSVKITGGTSVAIGESLALTASASGFSGEITYDWVSAPPSIAAVEKDSTNPSKATVTGVAKGDATITVKAKSGGTEESAVLTVTVTEKQEAPEATLWKISDYFSDLGDVPNSGTAASLSSLGFENGKKCENVIIGSNVKVRSDGNGKKDTITDGIVGYCQLSNGKAGSLLLTVPAGATKITLGAKNTNKSLAIYNSSYDTPLKEFTDDVNGDYADYVYEYAFTEETQIYITSPNKTTNFKAIKVE